MNKNPEGFTGIRLAELIGALSIATDLAMGQPLEYALCSCVLSVRLGEKLGMGEAELREVYYQALLRYIGCNAETHMMASIVGDELAMRSDYASVDGANLPQVVSLMMRHIRLANADTSPLNVARMMLRGLMYMPQIKDSFSGHCEVAQRLAERMGFGERVILALGQLYERWDGKGMPRGIKGEEIAPAVLVVTLAQDALTFFRLGGTDAAVNMARERKGAAYAPEMVEIFCQHSEHLLNGLEQEQNWEEVLALEPGPRHFLTGAQLDVACRAMADFADIKSPYTITHSSGVAELAAKAAQRCGLPEEDVVNIRRAGLLHDLGRVGISAGVWGKPGPLTVREWEQVRLHPYYTERVLARPQTLARLGVLAGHHHERMDGTGYHRGSPSQALPPAARILAAADAYHAMTEPRPHRPERSPEAAAEELRRDTKAGRFDSEAVNAVLAAAGHRVPAGKRQMVAGLSEREIEVLRLLARGNSIKQIASLLSISEKTVDNHIQHIYNKIGVTTRAGATLFAMEQDLLSGVE